MRFVYWAVLGVAVAIGGCSDLPITSPSPTTINSPNGKPAVVNYALQLRGIPYRLGGASPDGFDCSGFVVYVFNNALGVRLPRTSEAIFTQGKEVEKSALVPGDLVFYNTTERDASHVGIYLGDGQFIHASNTNAKGITVSRMSEPYWIMRFLGARRLL